MTAVDEGPSLSLLDTLLANAWPALEEERQGQWRYRWCNGVTSRANSVLAIGGDDDLVHLVAHAESFYAARGAPVQFRVGEASSPPALSGLLEARGYRPEKLTQVMTADASVVAERIKSGVWATRVSPDLSDDWFDCYWSVEAERQPTQGTAATFSGVFLNSGRPQRFISAVDSDSVVATGQAVFETGWCGVQCMATRATHRGRGAASAVLAAVASEATRLGVDRMYLAVMADNSRGLSLYVRTGFRGVYQYQYWR